MMKKLLRNMLLVSLLLISCAAIAAAAYADTVDKLPGKKEFKDCALMIHSGETAEFDIVFPSGTKFSKVKASKKAIKVSTARMDGARCLCIKTKKAVKGTVSYTASYKGKKRRYKVSVTAVKYKNPFKSIKVGKTDYTKFFKKAAYTHSLDKEISGKLSIKMNKGFKLEKVFLNEKKIKNNQKITLKEGSCIAMYYSVKSLPKKYQSHFLIPLEVAEEEEEEEE